MKKIGYLGPSGTFTEAAARSYSGGDAVDLVCCHSFQQIVSSVKGGLLDEGVVPLENSTEGAVSQILDLLAQEEGVRFRGEMILKVSHNLLVRPGTTIGQIKKVLSHPQALAQCRGYLSRELPLALVEETASTARAAGIVAESAEPWAAIGTGLAARNCGLEVAGADIQDSSQNATRFIVLSRYDAEPGDNCKTSIIVEAKDRPGALYGILREFALRDISLTRIESRPVKKRLGQYMFFIDLEGHRSHRKVGEALEAVARNAYYLRVLGSYPADLSQAPREAFPPGQGITLEEARAEIDMVDRQIVELIGMRTRLVEKIAGVKKDPGRIRDVSREEEVLRRVRSVAGAKGADPEMIESVYRIMMARYVKMQERKLQSLD
jgi:prephenate dehydratase